MTTTAFVVTGCTSYHTSADCQALDSARLNAGAGTVRVSTVEQAAMEQRPPCVVCAAPPAEEWTVTSTNCGQLWELIEHSKPHIGYDPFTGRTECDGLTIRPEGSATGRRVVALFGDTIRRCPDGRYAVTPVATTES